MQQVQITYAILGKGGVTETVRMCDEPCMRYLAEYRGYFDVITEEGPDYRHRNEATVQLRPCEKNEAHRAQAIVALTSSGEPVWQCLDC